MGSDGIQGLYRGFVISAVGIFVYRGLYFGLYDTLKPMLLGADAGVGLSFILGWAITVTAGLISYPNVLRYFPTQALNFAFKDSVKALFATPKTASSTTKFATNIASGGCAGTMSLLFVYSLDYARTRLANDTKGSAKGGERQFNGLVDVYVKTFKSDGIQGLYRGFVISAVGIFVYRGLYFGLYDTLKPMLLGADAGVGLSFILGWAITVTAGLISYPIDTIRRRMMMTSGASVKYKNSMDCGIQVIKGEGFMSLMKGAGANILRGVAGAGVLAGFDAFKAVYVKWRVEQA